MTPEQRSMRARIGAHASWANTSDVRARMAPALAGQMARFEREVDPDGLLPIEERERRAEHARHAHMLRMSAKSADVRRRRKASSS